MRNFYHELKKYFLNYLKNNTHIEKSTEFLAINLIFHTFSH